MSQSSSGSDSFFLKTYTILVSIAGPFSPLNTFSGTLIADAFELAAGKSISTLTLLEAPEFGNTDCTVTITAFRDGKQIGTLNTELTLHTAYLWPKEVQ